MKAIKYNEYGTEDVIHIENVPVPKIGDNEILIKVLGTSFNPLDVMIRMGYLKDFLPIKFPFTPNVDVSGVVVEIGSEVKGFEIGDPVYGLLDKDKDGGAAEYVVSRSDIIAKAPKNIPISDVGTIPLAGLTAWQSLFEYGNLSSGQKILIVGASGGVGTFAIQLAKWKGAYVIGTSNKENFEALKNIGIDEVYEYDTSLTKTLSQEFDMILNLTTLESEGVSNLLYLLKTGGVLVSTLNPADEEIAKKLNIKSAVMMHHQDVDHLNKITSIIEEGKLKPLISEKVSLEKFADIHKKVGKTYGKILIIP